MDARWTPSRVLESSQQWVSPWRPPGSTLVEAEGYRMYVLGDDATLMNGPDPMVTDRNWVRGAVDVAADIGAESLSLMVGSAYRGSESAREELASRAATVVATADIRAMDLEASGFDRGPRTSDVTVLEVATGDDVVVFERTSALAWGYPPPTEDEIDDARRRLGPGWFLAHVCDTPSGTSGFALVDDVARFWGAAVVPAWRGRGVYRSLVAARIDAARARGAGLALVHAAPTSSPILERLGFAKYGQIQTFRVVVRNG